jgi:hypothetical protein
MNQIRRPMPKKPPADRYWKGFVAGLIIPFVGYAVLLLLYDQLDALGVISDRGFSPNFRERTLALIAICLLILPAQYFKKNYMTDAIRGLTFPMLIYVGLWLYFYVPGLFG